MNIHELRDNLSSQKLTNQPFLFRSKNDLDGKLVETIMPFKYIEPFENYLESVDEHYDEGSIISQEAVIFIEKDTKKFIKFKRSDYGKGFIYIVKRLLNINVEIVIHQVKE